MSPTQLAGSLTQSVPAARPLAAALAAAAIVLPVVRPGRAGARPGQDRRRRRDRDRRGGQYLDLADGWSASSRGGSRGEGGRAAAGGGRRANAAGSARFAVRGFLRGILQEPPRRSGWPGGPGAENIRAAERAAPRQFARLRLRHRRHRARRDQQSRHRGSRRDHRRVQRRLAPEGRSRSAATRRPISRCCGQADEAAQGGEVRRFRQAAARRMGDRDRQSVQPRRLGHRRHRLGAQPRHQFRPLRQLHPDRRRRSIAAIPAARCST